MSGFRSNSLSNVSWRAAIQIAPGNIIAAKVIGFTHTGLQLQCASLLRDGQTYQMMMEVPDPRDASARTQVTCKATCQYAILSGNEYRAGMKYFEVHPQYQALLNSWSGQAAA